MRTGGSDKRGRAHPLRAEGEPAERTGDRGAAPPHRRPGAQQRRLQALRALRDHGDRSSVCSAVPGDRRAGNRVGQASQASCF